MAIENDKSKDYGGTNGVLNLTNNNNWVVLTYNLLYLTAYNNYCHLVISYILSLSFKSVEFTFITYFSKLNS